MFRVPSNYSQSIDEEALKYFLNDKSGLLSIALTLQSFNSTFHISRRTQLCLSETHFFQLELSTCCFECLLNALKLKGTVNQTREKEKIFNLC